MANTEKTVLLIGAAGVGAVVLFMLLKGSTANASQASLAAPAPSGSNVSDVLSGISSALSGGLSGISGGLSGLSGIFGAPVSTGTANDPGLTDDSDGLNDPGLEDSTDDSLNDPGLEDDTEDYD